jgi:hypothetical protein
VWLFLMFTMIDLNGRSTITEWRGGEIVAGGSGVGIKREGFGSGAIHETVKENYIAEKGIESYKSHLHGHHGPEQHNSKDFSRVPTGLTPGLFDTGPWAELNSKDDADHGSDH